MRQRSPLLPRDLLRVLPRLVVRGPLAAVLCFACAPPAVDREPGPPPPGLPGGPGPGAGAVDGGPRPPGADQGQGFDAAGASEGGGADPPAAGQADAGRPMPGPGFVRMARVEAAQGVFFPLPDRADGPPAVPAGAELIEGRPLFVRVHLVASPGFQPRPVRALLELSWATGGQSLEVSRQVAGSSAPERLDSSLNFLVPAAAVRPGLALRLFLLDPVESGGVLREPPFVQAFPVAGPLPLAVGAWPMALDLVIVPTRGPGNAALADTPERRRRAEEYLYDVFPVKTLKVTWRAPVALTEKITSAQALQIAQEVRAADRARPDQYYHLMVAAESSLDDVLGYALSGVTGEAADGAKRVSVSYPERAVDDMLDTVAHEIGHNHGRLHAPGCRAQSLDAEFPHPDGGIGGSGFLLSKGTLVDVRAYKDLMGYCTPTWVSDYTWRHLAARVRAVSAWAEGGPRAEPKADRTLVGFLGAGAATPAFTVVEGGWTGAALASADRHAVVTLADGGRQLVGLAIERTADAPIEVLAVPLPPAEPVARVEIVLGERHFKYNVAQKTAARTHAPAERHRFIENPAWKIGSPHPPSALENVDRWVPVD